MDAITLIAFVACIYLAAYIAERRGRSVRAWAWTAVLIGPLAFPLIFMFPSLHRRNGDQT